jgi:hypothetical protein
MTEERRTPVQGDGLWWLREDDRRRLGSHRPGTIAWSEHLEAWTAYHKRWPDQSAGVVAERGGFFYNELVELLGHAPKTWVAR